MDRSALPLVGTSGRAPASAISHFDASLPALTAQARPSTVRPVQNGYTLQSAALEHATAHLEAATQRAEEAAATLSASPCQFRSLGPSFNSAVRKAHSTASDALRALATVTSTARTALDQTRHHYTKASELNAGAIGPTFPTGATGAAGST